MKFAIHAAPHRGGRYSIVTRQGLSGYRGNERNPPPGIAARSVWGGRAPDVGIHSAGSIEFRASAAGELMGSHCVLIFFIEQSGPMACEVSGVNQRHSSSSHLVDFGSVPGGEDEINFFQKVFLDAEHAIDTVEKTELIHWFFD